MPPRRGASPAALVLALLAAPLVAAPAEAGPRGTLIHRPPSPLDQPVAAAAIAKIIYLNRCESGCTIRSGYPNLDDSVANISSIIQQTANMSPFHHSDAVWQRTVDCVKFVYLPFGVEVVTEDPSPLPHFEAIVAGTPDEAGFDPDLVGGVGVGGCGYVTDNSISFTFANIWPADANTLCYVIAQETAHNLGLDHELEPSDPLTYLPYDGLHLFADRAVDCGEDVPRQCCDYDTVRLQQNSHQYILDLFGPGPTEAAPIELVRPTAGATLPPGFAIEVSGSAYVERVVVRAGDKVIADSALRPFVFNAPLDLPPGPLTIEATGTDARGKQSTASVSLTVTEPPPDPDDDGGCAAGGAAGGLGALVCAAGLALGRRRRRRPAD
jgi:hypothetical protein